MFNFILFMSILVNLIYLVFTLLTLYKDYTTNPVHEEYCETCSFGRKGYGVLADETYEVVVCLECWKENEYCATVNASNLEPSFEIRKPLPYYVN